MTQVHVIARKEAGELLLDLRGLSWLLCMAVALSTFGLLLISNVELSLLDNAQVVYDMAAIMTGLGALLALIVGIDTVGGERERSSLIPLLLVPLSRTAILVGKLHGVAIAWAVLYLLALPYLWSVGSTGQNLGDAMLATAVFGTPVVLGFSFLGMILGNVLRSTRAALTIGLVVMLVAASPIIIGPSLRQSMIGQMFDIINPISAAVNSYDGIIIDSQSIVDRPVELIVASTWFLLTLLAARTTFQRLTR